MSKARDLADLLDSSGDVKSAKLDNVPTYSDVTDTASGLMKKDHKIKLAGIETGATGDQTKADIEALGVDYTALSNAPALATVATTGSYADLTNVPDVSASSLSSNFTVATGKTVTAGTVANLYGGEIGTNPVANSQGTEQSYSAETFNYITGDGNFIVKSYSNGSGHHCAKVIRTSDMTQTADSTIYSGHTGCGTSIKQLSANRFVLYGKQSGAGARIVNSGGANWWKYHTYNYIVMFEVSSTGTISSGSAWTHDMDSGRQDSAFTTIHDLDGDNTSRGSFYLYTINQYYSGGWSYSYGNSYYTFPLTGTLNISLSGSSSGVNDLDGSILNTAGTKLTRPSTGTSWNISDWNGSTTSNDTTITNNRTNLSSAQFIKPDPTSDKLLCFYINTNLELCVETLDWTSSSIDVVANSKWIVESDASGVSLGSIKGSTAGVGITYENGSKGRFKSLSLDSNLVVTGSSSLMTVNNSNVVPGLAYKGNDVFQVWNNNVDTFTSPVTVNAYSTSPLTPLGVIKTNGSAGDSIAVQTRGIVGGFTGLTADAKYYYDTSVFDGTVTLTNTGTYVGRAVSTTQIQLTDLTEQ